MDLQQSLNFIITWLHRRLFNFLRWLRLFSLFGGYSWRNLLSAVGVCLLAAFAMNYVFLPDWQVEWLQDKRVFLDPVEAVTGDDGSLFVNDREQKIIAINPDGTLRYVLNASQGSMRTRISDIAVDEHDKLFAYVTVYQAGGQAIENKDICMYDAKGNFTKRFSGIYTNHMGRDWSSVAEGPAEGAQFETSFSPLYVHGGRLQYVYYQQYGNAFYEIDIATGESKLLYQQRFSVPYLYQSIYLIRNHGYYFVKVNGETGYGIMGKGERIIYKYNYDINDNMPFISMLLPLDGSYYCYDAHGAGAWTLRNEDGFTPAFTQDSGMQDYSFHYMNVSNGRLCGVAANLQQQKVVWYIDYDGKVHELDGAQLSFRQMAAELAVRFLYLSCMVLIALSLLYIISAILYAYVGPRTSILRKLVLILPIVLCIVLYMMYDVFNYYQADYARQDYERLEREVQVLAGSLDGGLLVRAKDSQFFDTTAYRILNDRLDETFARYSRSHGEASAAILVQGEQGAYVVADTQEHGRLLSRYPYEPGYDNLLAQVVSNRKRNGGVAAFLDEDEYRFYAPIRDSASRTRGYLCVSMPRRQQSSMFWYTVFTLWPGLLFGLGLIMAALSALALSLGRSAAQASEAITRIAEGNLSVRVDRATNDEIGNISRCINRLAASLEESSEKNRALNQEIQSTQLEVIASFAEIVEAKSGQTGHHVKRVAAYTELMALAAGYGPEESAQIRIASMMHDVGKLMIPSSILDKPDRLTEEEFQIVKLHTVYGEQLLHNVPSAILSKARVIAVEHHERYDGRGYPRHLAGERISPLARIVSIADVFDALVSRRSYKESWSVEEAFSEIEAQSGKQFDPHFVDIFLAHKVDVMAIREQLADHIPDEEPGMPDRRSGY